MHSVITALSFTEMSFREPYIQINCILLILLLSIFAYSFFYPLLAEQEMTVSSSCEEMPERYCKSRGLSRAFAQIMHGNIEKARTLNKYAVSVFSFFALQCFARIVFSLLYQKLQSNKLAFVDSVFSGIYFVYTFFPLTFLSS